MKERKKPVNKLYEFGGKGTIWSYTRVFDAPNEFQEYAPYYLALVKLDEGPMLMAQLTDLDPDEPVEIGMPVEMVTRRLKADGNEGVIVYGYKFRRPIRSYSK